MPKTSTPLSVGMLLIGATICGCTSHPNPRFEGKLTYLFTEERQVKEDAEIRWNIIEEEPDGSMLMVFPLVISNHIEKSGGVHKYWTDHPMMIGFLVQKQALQRRQVGTDDQALQAWAVDSERVFGLDSFSGTKKWWNRFVKKTPADRQATDEAKRLFGRVEFRETDPGHFEVVAKLSTQIDGKTIEVIDGRFYVDTVYREVFFSSILGFFMLIRGDR